MLPLSSKMNAVTMLLVLLTSSAVSTGPSTDCYNHQYCTDPRTLQKHKAHSEWSDAYSCTRHRCQPCGRSLAVYTVGCKRVEAPESAIECEEVVEDTNMQFPYCCTRLRCLVVVRGEIWTRVFGQPWEHLPAAPWSHMYKMKKPPPTEGEDFAINPTALISPFYELNDPPSDNEKILRPEQTYTNSHGKVHCKEPVPGADTRAAPGSDIGIAHATNSDLQMEDARKDIKKTRRYDHIRMSNAYLEERVQQTTSDLKMDEQQQKKQKRDDGVEELVFWTEIPQNLWHQHEKQEDSNIRRHKPVGVENKKDQTELQDVVNAIGTRMKDIEHVVQRISETGAIPGDQDPEKGTLMDSQTPQKRHKLNEDSRIIPKQPAPSGEDYKRFAFRGSGSKYIHTRTDTTTGMLLYIEDNNSNGYYSDTSNNAIRRSTRLKEPALVYLAPEENRRKAFHIESEDAERNHKKHLQKKNKKRHSK